MHKNNPKFPQNPLQVLAPLHFLRETLQGHEFPTQTGYLSLKPSRIYRTNPFNLPHESTHCVPKNFRFSTFLDKVTIDLSLSSPMLISLKKNNLRLPRHTRIKNTVIQLTTHDWFVWRIVTMFMRYPLTFNTGI